MEDTKFLLLFLLLNSSTLCFSTEHDIQCLKSVQQSVIDPLGVLKSSWNFRNNTDGYICRFTGVECWHPDENRVLSLRLGNLGLEGPFPHGLQNCTSMSGLDLSYNNFSGPIPSGIAQQIPYVTSLNLSYNNFSSEIPESIANLAYLNMVNLQHNQLRGQIPERFSVLGRLTSFNVADNLLSGPIPTFAQDFLPLYFAGNRDLCGAPLDECPRSRRWRLIPIRPHRINEDSSIGAAVGFVLGFVVAFYFQHSFVCSKRLRAFVVAYDSLMRPDHLSTETENLAYAREIWTMGILVGIQLLV
ncbi:probably inactive leucine-rich repeat receptor-like protein kinase At5g48380 [Triticum aestivum]|uniref:probably inactive leucine-rich repeat receptor-like protein kinase At5g48380 n=1 Tax=Triticum aestivum TaxID=4565 RepID=UPI001D011252|nr:probably inactive leucine-rich repeat receptor-like protein kinase At5g48380 [Triticum aestivum]